MGKSEEPEKVDTQEKEATRQNSQQKGGRGKVGPSDLQHNKQYQQKLKFFYKKIVEQSGYNYYFKKIEESFRTQAATSYT